MRKYKNHMVKNSFAILLFVFVACSSKSNDITNHNQDFSNPYEYIGKGHNEVCKFLLEEEQNLLKANHAYGLTLNAYKKITKYAYKYAKKNAYDTLAVSNCFDTMEKLYEDAGVIYSKGKQKYLLFSMHKLLAINSNAVKKGIVTKKVVNEIEPIIQATANGATLDEVRNMVQNLPIETYDSKTMAAVLAFVSVFNNSSLFWYGNGFPLKKGAQIQDEVTDLLIIDAWGSLYGLVVGGGAGSIIGGAVASIAYHEGVQNN